MATTVPRLKQVCSRGPQGSHLSAPLPVYCTTFRSVQVSISRTQWPSVVRGAMTRKGLTCVTNCAHGSSVDTKGGQRPSSNQSGALSVSGGTPRHQGGMDARQHTAWCSRLASTGSTARHALHLVPGLGGGAGPTCEMYASTAVLCAVFPRPICSSLMSEPHHGMLLLAEHAACPCVATVPRCQAPRADMAKKRQAYWSRRSCRGQQASQSVHVS